MNVAIEYILRNGRVEQLLTLPCSLFLEKKKDKVVITMMPKYGTSNVVVRQFNLSKCSADEMLPPFSESVCTLKEIWGNPNIVLEGYKLLDFQEQPFDHEQKQVADFPIAAVQERQYRERLQSFFAPKVMARERENWLWGAFIGIYVSSQIRLSMRQHYYDFAKPDVQRELIRREHKAINKTWEFWKKSLLLNSDPAAELVFAKHYNSEFLKYVPPPEPEMPPQAPVPPKPKKKRSASRMMYYPIPDFEGIDIGQMIQKVRRKAQG